MTPAHDDLLIGPVAPPLVHLMTFNLRRPVPWSWRGDDRWSVRRPAVRELLASERPSVLAAQEVTEPVAAVVRGALGASYAQLGTGRDARGDGEMCPLYVDTDRLEVHAHAQIALSPHPERPGSRGWAALFPRVAVVATLSERTTGAMFTAVGTHFDHVSGRARRMAARQLSELVWLRGLPAVLMGDLNAGADSPAVRHLTGEGGLRDAWRVAAATASAEIGTRPGYRVTERRGRRIDHILVTPGIDVVRVGANAWGAEGRRPSDHLPVQATVRVAQPKEQT